MISAPKHITEELAFISARTNWLKTQQRDADGTLCDLDLVLEAGTLRRRIDELEAELLAS